MAVSYASQKLRLILYGGISLILLYISLGSNLLSSMTRPCGGLRAHHEVNAGLQQPGAVERQAHADRSFNYLENIPSFKHLPTYNDIEASLSGLSKRDVCSDAIPGTVSNTCTPGNTLCCVSLTKSFPQCQVIINSGYCCVSPGPSGGCYIDLPASACGTSGAVQCTVLAEGTSNACCPAGTTCPDNFNQSNTDVRCQIPYPSSSSSSSSSSSTSIPSSSSSSSITSGSTSGQTTASASPAVASVTPSNPSISSSTTRSSTLSGGAIAGITIGAVAIILLAALIFLLLKKRRNNARDPVGSTHSAAAAPPNAGIPFATTAAVPYSNDPYKQWVQHAGPVGEMEAVQYARPLGEMEAVTSGPHLSRHELDTSAPER